MTRKIITIDEAKCDGCGACVDACHEGAIGMRLNKAALVRDDYCDGLGDCLSACPTGAISVEEREALPYNEAAVLENMRNRQNPLPCGCPGSYTRVLSREEFAASIPTGGALTMQSELRQWPVQIKLVPVNADFFSGAELLLAADCAAYAHGNFHAEFMRGRVTLIACPKLDATDYSERLAEIFEALKNDYSQTCSKTEQLTLALFMEYGYYQTNIKKLRSLYSQKLQTVLNSIHNYAHNFITPANTSSGINMIINVKSDKGINTLCEEANSIGISVVPISIYTDELKGDALSLIFYYNQIPLEQIDGTIKALASRWFGV
jgi:NAD-dependent dihydropyrimidine dehydrogenase PreA subunit